jgi:hypothetical protein
LLSAPSLSPEYYLAIILFKEVCKLSGYPKFISRMIRGNIEENKMWKPTEGDIET